MKLEDAPDVLTVEEAAAILRIGRTAAYEAARRREIPAVRVGRSLRVPRRRLEQLLTAAGPTPAETNGAGGEPGAAKGTENDRIERHDRRPPRR